MGVSSQGNCDDNRPSDGGKRDGDAAQRPPSAGVPEDESDDVVRRAVRQLVLRKGLDRKPRAPKLLLLVGVVILLAAIGGVISWLAISGRMPGDIPGLLWLTGILPTQ